MPAPTTQPTATTLTTPEPEFELTSPVTGSSRPPAPVLTVRPIGTPALAGSLEDIPVRVQVPGATPSTFKLPVPPAEVAEATWVHPSNLVSLGGRFIAGGMFYLGGRLTTPMGNPDPCLINPELPVSAGGNFLERQTAYWPSYAELTPIARKAYLDWMADGRKHPDIDTGVVYLYFYGLERRAIWDGTRDEAVLQDFPPIATELRRLLGLYGKRSNALRDYIKALLQLVELAVCPADLYNHPVPDLEKGWELPMHIRLAIGQVARDKVPLPAALAYAWATLDPGTVLRTPATRCSAEFKQLFLHRYCQVYGEGMTLAILNNKLKLQYSPASPGFRTHKETSFSFDDAPNIIILPGPANALRAMVEEVTGELEGYSRLVQKIPHLPGTLESIAYLPAKAWPSAVLVRVSELHELWALPTVMTLEEVWGELGVDRELSKDRATQVMRALDAQGISMLPNLLRGARMPKPDEHVLVFSDSVGASAGKESVPFCYALEAVTVASSLCTSTSIANEALRLSMANYLRKRVECWAELSPLETRRLLAHFELLLRVPVTPAQLKKLDLHTDEMGPIVELLLGAAVCTGTPGAAVVQLLEKTYKVLGLNPKKVWGDLHAVHAGQSTSANATPAPAGGAFSLDLDRIAVLQRETEKVSVLLAGIFTDADTVPEALEVKPMPAIGAPATATPAILPGLDLAHLKLVDILMSEPQWSRDSLLEATRSLGLMLDGALERINEVSFDTYDFSFTEGDDPIEVSSDILELLKK